MSEILRQELARVTENTESIAKNLCILDRISAVMQHQLKQNQKDLLQLRSHTGKEGEPGEFTYIVAGEIAAVEHLGYNDREGEFCQVILRSGEKLVVAHSADDVSGRMVRKKP